MLDMKATDTQRQSTARLWLLPPFTVIVFLLHLVHHFLAEDGHGPRGVHGQADLVAADGRYGDLDVVSDEEGLAYLASDD